MSFFENLLGVDNLPKLACSKYVNKTTSWPAAPRQLPGQACKARVNTTCIRPGKLRGTPQGRVQVFQRGEILLCSSIHNANNTVFLYSSLGLLRPADAK